MRTEPIDVLARVLDDDVLADPHPYLAWLRDNRPVHLEPGGFYVVATHADCLTVSSRLERFRGPRPDEIAELFPLARRYSAIRMMVDTLAMKNPPGHTRLRRLYSRDFTPRHIARMQANTALRCREILDAVEERLRDGTTIDVHTEISQRLPEQVIADLLGLPEPDREWLFARFHAVLETFVPGVTAEALDAAQAASDEVRDYMTDLIDQCRRTPADGLVSAWVRWHDEDPDEFTRDELLAMLWGLIAGGTATTAAGLSSGVLCILSHPETTGWLRAGDAEARGFAREVLRHHSPSFVAGIPRFAVADVELARVPIPAGSDVRTLLGAANRDPSVFPDPDRFDPGRDTAKSLSLGHGVHFCLGANVALQELMTMLTALHRRFPSLEFAGEPRWRRALPIRGLEHLPVALGESR